MRNTTKLKQILLKYDLAISMEEENLLKLTMVDKNTGSFHSFEHSSYSQLLSKCYSFFLKDLREAGSIKSKLLSKLPAARQSSQSAGKKHL